MTLKILVVAFYLSFCLEVLGQNKTDILLLRMQSPHTSFPDTARAQGYTYQKNFFSAAEHYGDSSIILLFPRGLKKADKVDLIFWFHGWNNNIDTAMEFYELRKQFIESRPNAVFVLAETARNAPDSYGGKLEQPGLFRFLVNDILQELRNSKAVPHNAETGSVVLGGHSGAYRVIARIIQNGQVPVQEVFLFDALYAELPIFLNWIKSDNHHHFINWYTNHGGGTDEMSIRLMDQLQSDSVRYALVEESNLNADAIRKDRVLFVHSAREHNVIINDPDNLALLLTNSYYLKSE